jgi:hypothetical protein
MATTKTHGFAAAAQSPVARVARIVASLHGRDLELIIKLTRHHNSENDLSIQLGQTDGWARGNYFGSKQDSYVYVWQSGHGCSYRKSGGRVGSLADPEIICSSLSTEHVMPCGRHVRLRVELDHEQ